MESLSRDALTGNYMVINGEPVLNNAFIWSFMWFFMENRPRQCGWLTTINGGLHLME